MAESRTHIRKWGERIQRGLFGAILAVFCCSCRTSTPQPAEEATPVSNVSEPTTEKEKPKNPDKLGQKRKKRPLVIRQIPSSIPALSSQPIPPAAPKSTPPPIVPSPVAPRGEETPKSAPHESQSHESQLGDEELRERLIDSLLKDQTGGAEKERH